MKVFDILGQIVSNSTSCAVFSLNKRYDGLNLILITLYSNFLMRNAFVLYD